MIYVKIVPAIISVEKGCEENELTAKGDWLNKLGCMLTVEGYPPTKNDTVAIHLFGKYLWMWPSMSPVLSWALMTPLRTSKCLYPPGIYILVEEKDNMQVNKSAV